MSKFPGGSLTHQSLRTSPLWELQVIGDPGNSNVLVVGESLFEKLLEILQGVLILHSPRHFAPGPEGRAGGYEAPTGEWPPVG